MSSVLNNMRGMMIKMNIELNKLLSNLEHLDRAEAMVKALVGLGLEHTPNAYRYEVLRKIRIIISFKLYHIDDMEFEVNVNKVVSTLSDILRSYTSELKGTPEYGRLLLPHSEHKCSEYMTTMFNCNGCKDLFKCPIGNNGFCGVCGNPFK